MDRRRGRDRAPYLSLYYTNIFCSCRVWYVRDHLLRQKVIFHLLLFECLVLTLVLSLLVSVSVSSFVLLLLPLPVAALAPVAVSAVAPAPAAAAASFAALGAPAAAAAALTARPPVARMRPGKRF